MYTPCHMKCTVNNPFVYMNSGTTLLPHGKMARGRPGEVKSGHESAGPMAAYSARLKVMVKVLDFVKSGGPILTIDRTVFEMWLGSL